MVSSRSADDAEYMHFGSGATGLHYLHNHRAGALAERGSGAVALDLPSTRTAPLRNSKFGGAAHSQTFGMLSLLAVAALWGSYSPVLKFLFSQPSPPSAALMTATQALLAAAFLLVGNMGAAASGRDSKWGMAAPGSKAQVGPALVLGAGLVTLLRSAIRASGLSFGLMSSRRREPLFPPKQPLQSTPNLHPDPGGGNLSPSQQQQQQQLPGRLSRQAQQLRTTPSMQSDVVDGGGASLGPVGLDATGPGSEGHVPLPSIGSSGAAVAGSGTGTAHAPSGPGRPLRSVNLLALPLGSLSAVGLELGTYNFCAVALGTWGVQRISATKVAFLGQATSLVTPLLVALSGQRVAAVVWAACCGGVLGGAMVALDGSGRAAAMATAGAGGRALTPPLLSAAAALADSAFGSHHGVVSRAMRLENSGDSGAALAAATTHPSTVLGHNSLPPALSRESMGVNYVLASCIFYALGTVRMGVHSSRFPPLDLAAASAVAYAALALVWLLLEVFGTPTGGQADYAVVALLLRDNAAMALVLWAGFGPGALSSYLQALGQRVVPAAQAQMLYSSTPLWSALIARLLLRGHDGAMGPLAWLGGGIMLSASLLASLLDAMPVTGSKASPATTMAGSYAAGQVGANAMLGGASSRWSGGGAGGSVGGHQHKEERDL